MRIYAKDATSAQNSALKRFTSSLKNLIRKEFGCLFQKTRKNVKNAGYVLYCVQIKQ